MAPDPHEGVLDDVLSPAAIAQDPDCQRIGEYPVALVKRTEGLDLAGGEAGDQLGIAELLGGITQCVSHFWLRSAGRSGCIAELE